MSNTEGKRFPNWTRDELILALDLYCTLDYPHNLGRGGVTRPEVIELSNLLRGMKYNQPWVSSAQFRNPNSVSLKMSNFLGNYPLTL